MSPKTYAAWIPTDLHKPATLGILLFSPALTSISAGHHLPAEEQVGMDKLCCVGETNNDTEVPSVATPISLQNR